MANGHNWVRLGSTVINLDSMSYCELDGVSIDGGVPCVRIIFDSLTPDGMANSLSFRGEDYPVVRAFLEKYFNGNVSSSTRLPSQANHEENQSE